MQILVSFNEREEVKQALGELGMSVDLPFDFLLLSERGKIAVERKFFPDDFIASIGDGRFAKETAAMREWAEFRIIILEGQPRYTFDNRLRIGRRPSRWSKAGVRNMCRSLRYVEGCDLEDSDNILDTVEVLKELQHYFDSSKHLSLRSRPRFESDWLVPTYQERFTYWLQGGGPGISIIRARAIAKVFKNPMEVASAYIDGTLVEKLMSIPGIGEKVATSFSNFWKGVK